MSSSPRRSRGARAAAVSLLAAGAVVGGLMAGPPATAAPDGQSRPAASKQTDRYIVVLRAPSATQFDGGGSFARTSPRSGDQFNADSSAVRDYTRFLERTHRTIADQVGTDVAQDYTLAINGFAARLTTAQALDLAKDRRVLTVAPDVARKLNTWNTPDFLGMTGKQGAWAQHGGKRNAGAGTVVGILDTGIWPESKSFAGNPLTEERKGRWGVHRIGERTYMEKADGGSFSGACELGEGWNRNDCNTKLIGARYYPDAFNELPEDEKAREEWGSTRDGDGHGSHTAGTAAGQPRVLAAVEGRTFGRISGMAPGARIAAYKVCFSDTDPNSGDCFTSSSVAAIDDAIADGVDVINYSISGSQDTVDDPVELAFEGAAEAGIFVATSAGNSGPAPETVAHPSPWLTTVASTTHTTFENTIVLGNGEKFAGASIADTPVPMSPLVESVDAARPGADEEEADLCGPDTLDASQVSGKIVVCTRGVYDRVAKSAEVERAGGVGMILANAGPGSLDADFHSVPTVHVPVETSEQIWDYTEAEGDDAAAAIRLGNRTDEVTPVPQVTDSSSRGPSQAFDADILKPDLAAPGVSVLAAVAPPTNSGRDFDLYSGTSMASPHIAGLAAFVAGQNPGWTPMQIKSAMMTTARSVFTEDGSLSRDPFAQGAGLVRPKKFFDPGLFVTSGAQEWRGFLEGQGVPTGEEPVAAKDVNQPSMAMGQVVGSVEFDREFTASRAGTWDVKIKVPGFDGEASQEQLVASGAGDTEELTFTFTRDDAAFNEFTSGYVVLSGPTKVRIPVALRPVSVKAPEEVTGEGSTGSEEIEILPGFTGLLDLSAYGLEEAETHEDTVTNTANGFYDDYCVTITEDARVLRANLDAAPPSGDTLDLYIHSLQGDCSSDIDELYFDTSGASPAGDEQFTWVDPTPGSYLVSVELYEAPEGEDSVDYVLDIFNLDDTSNEGAFTVTPDPVPVESGEETSYEAEWTGLDPDKRYLGMIEYQDGLRPTFLTVDTAGETQP